jgi:hypothetical protein
MSKEETARAMVDATVGLIARKLKPLEQRIAALESERHKSLADAFQGPWLPRATYLRGALVQHAGGAWLALEDTDGKPGEAPGWRLLVRGAR